MGFAAHIYLSKVLLLSAVIYTVNRLYHHHLCVFVWGDVNEFMVLALFSHSNFRFYLHCV